MDRAGPFLSMLVTAALVVGGAVFGYRSPGPAEPWVYATIDAVGGFIVAAYVRVAVLRVLLPVWRRRDLAAQLLWMLVQAGCTLGGAWVGLSIDLRPEDNPVLMLMVSTVMGFSVGVLVTALWARSLDLMRYTLPRLVRRGLQKVRGRQNV